MTETTETFDPHSPLGQAQERFLATAAALELAKRAAGNIGRDLQATEAAWASARIENTTPAAFAEIDARRVLLLRASAEIKHRLGAAETAHKAAELPFRQKMRALLDARDRLERAEKHGNKTAAEAASAVIEQLTAPVEGDV